MDRPGEKTTAGGQLLNSFFGKGMPVKRPGVAWLQVFLFASRDVRMMR
jgi:hypothetical protein